MSWMRLMVDLRNQVWWACNVEERAYMSKEDRENNGITDRRMCRICSRMQADKPLKSIVRRCGGMGEIIRVCDKCWDDFYSKGEK